MIRGSIPGLSDVVKIRLLVQGSGCGSVGRVVASHSRGPRFKSSHRQKFILNIYCQLYWKDENEEKKSQEWPILEKDF